ncbi:tetraspanin-1-like [Clarias gariepinus]
MSCKVILKILMVIVNSAIFFAGAGTVIIGVLVEIERKQAVGKLNDKDIPPQLVHLAKAAYSLIAVGSILTIIGFLGCCGAMLENKCMLMTFFIIILVMFIVEVAAVAILLSNPQTGEQVEKLRKAVAKSIEDSYGEDETITKAWDQMMKLMECCGYNNYTDFTESKFVEKKSQYPQACCSDKNATCDEDKAESKKVIGCFDAVVQWVKKNSASIAGVAFSIVAIEIAAMIVSLILYKNGD